MIINFESVTVFIEDVDDLIVCDTCKSAIESSPIRIVTIKDGLHLKNLYFHYFFPCWDLEYLMQYFPGWRIVSSGFLCDVEILQKPAMVRNMEKNLDLWI